MKLLFQQNQKWLDSLLSSHRRLLFLLFLSTFQPPFPLFPWLWPGCLAWDEVANRHWSLHTFLSLCLHLSYDLHIDNTSSQLAVLHSSSSSFFFWTSHIIKYWRQICAWGQHRNSLIHCKMLSISLAFSVFQPWPCRGPSQASTYLLRICVPMSRNWRLSSLRSVESALQSSYLTAQKHISPMYIIVRRCVSEKMPDRKQGRENQRDRIILAEAIFPTWCRSNFTFRQNVSCRSIVKHHAIVELHRVPHLQHPHQVAHPLLNTLRKNSK